MGDLYEVPSPQSREVPGDRWLRKLERLDDGVHVPLLPLMGEEQMEDAQPSRVGERSDEGLEIVERHVGGTTYMLIHICQIASARRRRAYQLAVGSPAVEGSNRLGIASSSKFSRTRGALFEHLLGRRDDVAQHPTADACVAQNLQAIQGGHQRSGQYSGVAVSRDLSRRLPPLDEPPEGLLQRPESRRRAPPYLRVAV